MGKNLDNLKNDNFFRYFEDYKKEYLSKENSKRIELDKSFKLGFEEAYKYFNDRGMLLRKVNKRNAEYLCWLDKYFNKELIDLKQHFSNDELKMIQMLNIEIKDKIYTEYEFEMLSMQLLAYYVDKDIVECEKITQNHFDITLISRKSYNKLLDKISKINMFYNF